MAKQDAYLLVGLPHAGLPALTSALEQHRAALADVGVRVPARSADEAFRAAVEARREAKVAADGGYDVRGDLAELTPRPAGRDGPLAALRSALAETVAEVGRLRVRVDELSGAARRPRLRSAR